MKRLGYRQYSLVLITFILLLAFKDTSLAAMDEYCVTPPFVSQSISPNILIVLDNSGSMCGQAYSGDYNPTLFQSGMYYGYFDGGKNYQYTSNGRWEVTTAAMNTGTVANPIASGSFLNWAYMRRTEVSKKLLIGGKANPRSPQPSQTVKLDGETACDRNFSKDWDTSAGGMIYPFAGDYNFARNNSDDLTITGNDPAQQFYVFPESDLQLGSWQSSPGFSKVDEGGSGNGNTDYISNAAVASGDDLSPVLFGYNYAQATPAGVITVKVYLRALKTVTQQRRLSGILRIDGTDYLSPDVTLGTSYQLYSFSWDTNPATNAPWTWDEVKGLAASGNIGAFGAIANSSSYTANSMRITQMYMRVETTLPSGGPYSLIVDQGQVKATGLIDNLDNDVRFGLGFYNNNNAGRIDTYVGFNAPVNMITSIHNMVPQTWTPLGETLREMVGYFRQDSPYYSNSPADYSVGSGHFGGSNIYRDPYAYKFTDVDPNLTNMYVPCAKSFILFLTDGESTQDKSMPGSSTTSPYAECSATNLKACSGYEGPNPRFAGTTVGTTYASDGTDYMIDVAYWARTKDMRPGTETDVPTTHRKSLPKMQNIFLYPVFMFGTGSSLLQDAAIYGGFVDVNDNNKPDCTDKPSECYRDSNEDGVIKADGSDLPLTYYEGDDGYALEQNIKNAITAILKRAASGTAVSVLSSSEGSGANLIQSLFYPVRTFGDSVDISWTSDLMNYWYYFDPFFQNAQIREDSLRDDGSYTLLDLKSDYITQFYFDGGLDKTMAARCKDTDGDGDCDTSIDVVPIEEARAIWRGGVNLWWTDPADRTIFTSLDGVAKTSFDTTNRVDLAPLLGLSDGGAADATINYIRGVDQGKLCSVSRKICAIDSDCDTGEICESSRNRTVPMKVCTISRMPCSSDGDCTGAGGECKEETHTWKLGDVVSSTPKLMGSSPLNSYHRNSPFGYNDRTYEDFTRSLTYKDRQSVFVGSNDGMLHAFRLGKVEQNWPGKFFYQAGKLTGDTGTSGIGTERWAYVPKNALPYLQYLSKPDYCHLYLADGPVSLVDASINCSQGDYWNCAKSHTAASSSWKAIAIGSMGIGGATCDSSNSTANRIVPPITGNTTGISSYFALDVTDQDNPSVLWEFAHNELGTTNIGPAIIKVGRSKACLSNNLACTSDSQCGVNGQCVETNGRWFAVLASGSTGPIDQSEKSFKGTSDRNLKLFVLDLKTGTLLRTIDTGIANAFAGALSTGSLDLEKASAGDQGNYQDDVVYVGYVKDTTAGGVLRLVINDNIDPSNWTVSKVIDNIGPVTSSIGNLLDRNTNKLWLYFAEGRYHYKQDDTSNQRRIFAIQEPCYLDDTSTVFPDYDVRTNCSSSVAMMTLKDQTTWSGELGASQAGWYVSLDPATTTFGAERVITNPTTDTQGSVFFLSFAPTSDICEFGGTTYLWAFDYESGGKVTYTMQGKALVQVSTGEIKELDLSDENTFSERDNRRSVGFQGIPPTGQGLMVITPPSPIKKFMHLQEE